MEDDRDDFEVIAGLSKMERGDYLRGRYLRDIARALSDPSVMEDIEKAFVDRFRGKLSLKKSIFNIGGAKPFADVVNEALAKVVLKVKFPTATGFYEVEDLGKEPRALDKLYGKIRPATLKDRK
jgi:hypothetical protein